MALEAIKAWQLNFELESEKKLNIKLFFFKLIRVKQIKAKTAES